MRPSRTRAPTKLCVMVEARSDQPGVPADETFVHAVTPFLHFLISW